MSDVLVDHPTHLGEVDKAASFDVAPPSSDLPPSPTPSLPLRTINTISEIQHAGGNAIYNPSISGPVTFNFASSDDLRAKYLARYNHVNPLQERDRISQSKDELLDGSTAWVFDDAAFIDWDAPFDATNLLWIHGDAGKGKTMISLSAIDELHRQNSLNQRNAAILYFFCAYQDNHLNNAVSVLKGLIYCFLAHRRLVNDAVLDCLVQNDPLVVEHKPVTVSPEQQNTAATFEKSASAVKNVAKSAAEGGAKDAAQHAAEERARFDRDLAKYWTILTSLLDIAALDCVYIMVDAMDECGSGCLALLDRLTRRKFSTRVRWLITSRNEPEIAERVHVSAIKPTQLSLEENASHVNQSVQRFIDAKVQSLAERKAYDDATTARVKKHLSDGAFDTFLWVALACKELSDKPAYAVQDALLELPTGLPALYERMLSKTLDPHDAHASIRKSILETMSCAMEPMSLLQLSEFVDAPASIEVTPDLILRLVNECGSILTTKGAAVDDKMHSQVSFVHQSAFDYVASLQKTDRLASSQPIHLRLTGKAVRILAKSAQRNAQNLSSAELLEPSALVTARAAVHHTSLEYASKYWFDHMRQLRTGTYPASLPGLPARSLWHSCTNLMEATMQKTGPCILEIHSRNSHADRDADAKSQALTARPDVSFEVTSALSAYTGFLANGFREHVFRDASAYGQCTRLDWMSAFDVDAGGLGMFKIVRSRISPDEKTLALLGSRRFVILADLRNSKDDKILVLKQKNFTIRGGDHPIDPERAEFAPQSNYFAAALKTGGIELWSLKDKKDVLTSPNQWHINGCCFDFYPDSQLIAVGRGDSKRSICVYRTEEKRLVAVDEFAPSSGYTAKAVDLKISSDAEWFAELCDDGTLRFGSLKSKDQVAVIDHVPGLDTSPTRLEFSSDNMALVLWSTNRLVSYYSIVDGQLEKALLTTTAKRRDDLTCAGYMIASTSTLLTYQLVEGKASKKTEIVMIGDDPSSAHLKEAGLTTGMMEIPGSLSQEKIEGFLWKDTKNSEIRFPHDFADTLPPFVLHDSTIKTNDGKMIVPIAKSNQCITHNSSIFVIKFPKETVFDVFRVVRLNRKAFDKAYESNSLLPQTQLSNGERGVVDEFLEEFEQKTRKAIETGWKDQKTEFKDTTVGRMLWKTVYY